MMLEKCISKYLAGLKADFSSRDSIKLKSASLLILFQDSGILVEY